jgi:hypothetical protein
MVALGRPQHRRVSNYWCNGSVCRHLCLVVISIGDTLLLQLEVLKLDSCPLWTFHQDVKRIGPLCHACYLGRSPRNP